MAPFLFAAACDRLRLSVCRQYGAQPQRIRIASLGSATLLRCDDVRDFNVVYAPDERLSDRLDLVEDFYGAAGHGCHLVSATRWMAGSLARECERRGWLPDDQMAWLFGAAGLLRTAFDPDEIVVRRMHFDERDEFCHLFTRAGGEFSLNGAEANLRHLFRCPDFSFLLASWRNQPVGVSVLYHVGSSALLCESRVLPAYRGLGADRALIDARIRLAQSLGCVRVYAWAPFGTTDHADLLRAGLRTVRTTMTWRLEPGRLALEDRPAGR